jgi:hypothetical protein
MKVISKTQEGKEKLTFEYWGPQSEPNTALVFVSFSVKMVSFLKT